MAMSVGASVPEPDFTRPCANFRPSIWGDTFQQYDSVSLEDNDNMKQQAEKYKEEVKQMYLSLSNNISKKLNFIDSIQRLGISYHFDHEIDEALGQIHNDFTNNKLTTEESDLHYFALLFRLLRQNGYYISSDIFKKFMNNKGKFNEVIAQDVQGMWSLYEAAQLRIHGEAILEEALDFTYTNLKSMTMTNQLSPSLAVQINQSLRQPLHKEVPRIGARSYISFYEEYPFHSKVLLTFAKLDFNMLQQLHQNEVGSITKWDISPIESLPECMKVVFNAILELWDEIELVTMEGGKSSLVLQHIKQAFYELAQSYMVEAKWCHEGYIPTYDEYKLNGIVSSTLPLQIIAFLGLSGVATKQVFDSIINDPTILNSVSLLGRLMDDLGSHKFEQQREHVASGVECCMRQYDISEEEARKLVHKETQYLWKDVNEACLKLDDVPRPVLDCILNFSRITEFTYANFEDKYTNTELLKDCVVALLLDPTII